MTEKTPNNFFYSNNDDKQLIQIIIQHPKTDNAKLYINTENWIKLIGGNILTQTNLINIEFELSEKIPSTSFPLLNLKMINLPEKRVNITFTEKLPDILILFEIKYNSNIELTPKREYELRSYCENYMSYILNDEKKEYLYQIYPRNLLLRLNQREKRIYIFLSALFFILLFFTGVTINDNIIRLILIFFTITSVSLLKGYFTKFHKLYNLIYKK